MTISTRKHGGGRVGAVATILLALMISKTCALTQQYCSSQNTGADSPPVLNNFQSNGACSTTCSGYAFAVVQFQSCWCSNYVPADTTSTSDCSVACPGYPYENCGHESAGLFGYVALGPAPAGTQGSATFSKDPYPTQATQPTVQSVSAQSLLVAFSGASLPSVSSFPFTSSTSSVLRPSSFNGPFTVISSAPIPFETHVLTFSVQTLPPDTSPVTVLATVADKPSVQVSYVSITPTTTSTQQPTIIPVSITPDTTTTPITTSQTTPSTSSTWTPTPFTSLMTITGQVKTLTVTPTAPPAAATAATTIVAANNTNNGGFFSNSGKVAGTFVVLALVIVAVAGALIWFFFFRRKRREEAATIPSTAGGNTPQRRPSRLSQMGLIGATSEGEKSVPRLQTSGWGPGNSAEKSPADTLSADQRSSFPRVVDQRLEPTALWNPLHDNGSHVSVRSFRDDQDYSRRMLRIANPDDE